MDGAGRGTRNVHKPCTYSLTAETAEYEAITFIAVPVMCSKFSSPFQHLVLGARRENLED